MSKYDTDKYKKGDRVIGIGVQVEDGYCGIGWVGTVRNVEPLYIFIKWDEPHQNSLPGCDHMITMGWVHPKYVIHFKITINNLPITRKDIGRLHMHNETLWKELVG